MKTMTVEVTVHTGQVTVKTGTLFEITFFHSFQVPMERNEKQTMQKCLLRPDVSLVLLYRSMWPQGAKVIQFF